LYSYVQDSPFLHGVHNDNRIVAFRRWDETQEFLIVASLNNYSFSEGYAIQNSRLKDGSWRETFNSDTDYYGGYNVGNSGADIPVTNGNINLIIPANGFIVFQKIS
jgi:1,4-alpha-glucan branching enzyme